MYPLRTSIRRNAPVRRGVGKHPAWATGGTVGGAPPKRGGQGGWVPVRAAVESCREHINALYALGLIRAGDDALAAEAVVNAIAAAVADPIFFDAGPSQVWRLLASNIHGPGQANAGPATLDATAVSAAWSLMEEAVALAAAGKDPAEIAAMLETPPPSEKAGAPARIAVQPTAPARRLRLLPTLDSHRSGPLDRQASEQAR